jgi:2-octaprenyl-6-methoxyphenol hydroxylase
MDYDIGIIGGGLVGLVAAKILASQGRSVLLVEAREFALDEPDALDIRALALSLSSVNILNSIGLRDGLTSVLTPIRDIHISTRGHFGVTRLHATELGVEAMGQVVEYHALHRALLDAAKADPAIELCVNTVFDSLQQRDDRIELRLIKEDVERTLDVALVLVADGSQSAVREALGVATLNHEYGQSALIANIEVDEPRPGWAYERFTPQGPLALLPLSDAHYAMVWTRSHHDADVLMALDDREFLAGLQSDFGYRLGRMLKVGRRDRFDLVLRRANQLVGGRWALIGNAANTLHPVAGQGFNLALRDIAQLYDHLHQLDLAKADVGVVLDSYQRARKQDQRQTIALGHGLVSLFSNDWPVLRHIRAAGLAMFDLCPAAKQAFSWQAMGYGSGAASLMRGVS